MHQLSIRLSGVVCLCCAAVGCGGGISAPRTYVVKGTVLHQKKPAAGVRVSFHPQFDMGTLKFVPSGTTDAQGRFQLSTAKVNDGAPAGDYVVTFEKIVGGADRSGLDIDIDVWKGKYANPSTSKVNVSIQNAVELEPFRLD